MAFRFGAYLTLGWSSEHDLNTLFQLGYVLIQLGDCFLPLNGLDSMFYRADSRMSYWSFQFFTRLILCYVSASIQP